MSSSAEKFLGIGSEHEDNDLRVEIDTRSPTLGILAFFIPILAGFLGFAFGYLSMHSQDGSGAAWVASPLPLMILFVFVSAIISIVLAIISLWRCERWPLVPIFALAFYFCLVLDFLGF